MNTWAINHNPEEYPSPDTFDPSRWYTSKFGVVPESSDTADAWRRPSYAFGAGRRVCAGQRMAENSMLIHMAKLVWAFQIEPVGRREDLDLSVKTGFKDAILTAPGDVELRFAVRGKRREVVEREWRDADQWLKRFE
jgi:cytochrome P450